MPDLTGELAPADLETYTRGRLVASDQATKDALAAALVAARRFCRWHVTPVKVDVITMDGPGSTLLALPTLQIPTGGITSIVEDGVPVDLATLSISTMGKVRKNTGARWTSKYSGIVVTMSHGFAGAADFQRAVLSYADRASLAFSGGRPTVVGPFQYGTEEMSGGSAFSHAEENLLRQYRREARP